MPAEGEVSAEGLFGTDRPLHLEIGFGGGEHLAHRADLLPDHGFIGAEPFVNGVAQALVHIRDGGLSNVRIHHGDALEVLRRVPDGALTMLYLLHPDPWPKAKHAKRRMMNDGPLRLIADKLKPGGEFRFGTDHPVYLRHALMVMRRFSGEFEWLAEGGATAATPLRGPNALRAQGAHVMATKLLLRFRRADRGGAGKRISCFALVGRRPSANGNVGAAF